MANLCLICAGPRSNLFYPGYERNFWLEFSTPSSSSAAPSPRGPPRPTFLHPGTNGTVQTVTLGQTTHIDCQVAHLHDYQVR